MQEHPQLIRRSTPLRPASVELGQVPVASHYFDVPPPEPAAETVRYGALLRRYRKGFFAILATCILLSLLATALMKKSYRAKTVLEVMDINQDFMDNKTLNPNASLGNSDAFIETQTKLMQSESVADRVVGEIVPKIEAAPASDESQSDAGSWLPFLHGSKETPEGTVRDILSHVKVKTEGQSSLIGVTVEGPTPSLAADTANSLARQYINEMQQARWKTATRTAEFLTGQLDGMRKKLEASEDALQNYAQQQGLVYIGDSNHDSVDTDKLRQIQQDLEAARALRADKEAQLDSVQSSPAETLPQVVDDANIRQYTNKLADLREQIAQLRATYTPQHYKVRQAEDQIKAIETAIEQQRQVILNRMKTDYTSAVKREQIREKDYDKQVSRVSHQNVQEIRYNILKREVDANRDLYQTTLQKVKEASVVSAMRNSNVRVVDEAKPPVRPYQPNLVINLAIGTLAGLMLCVLYGLLRERSDESIRTPGQATRVFSIPELAAIPSAKRDVRIQVPMGIGRALPGGGKGTRDRVLSPKDPAGPNGLLEHCLHGTSIVAESFRSAVTSLLLWRGRGEQAPVLVVSSTHAKAGKTTSVFNLGLGLAESGRRVLVIDGDLRLPRLGDIFGLSSSAGLSDILSGTAGSSSSLELIQETTIPGLFVLPSGTLLPNVTQLLHSAKLDALLERLRTHFDFILIDSPPLVPLADARLLGQHADGMVLICRAGHTSMDQLAAVQRRLAADGTQVIGTILTDWNARSDDPSYLNSYAHYSKVGAAKG